MATSHFHYTGEDQEPPWANFLPSQPQPQAWYGDTPSIVAHQAAFPDLSLNGSAMRVLAEEEDYEMQQLDQPVYHHQLQQQQSISYHPYAYPTPSPSSSSTYEPAPSIPYYSPATLEEASNSNFSLGYEPQFEYAYDPTLSGYPTTTPSSGSSSSLYSFFNPPITSPHQSPRVPSIPLPSSQVLNTGAAYSSSNSSSYPSSSLSSSAASRSRPIFYSQPPTRNSSYSKLSGLGGSAPGTPTSVGGSNGYFGMEKFIPHQPPPPVPTSLSINTSYPHLLSNTYPITPLSPVHPVSQSSQPPHHQSSLLPQPSHSLRLSTSFSTPPAQPSSSTSSVLNSRPARPHARNHSRSMSYAPTTSTSTSASNSASSSAFSVLANSAVPSNGGFNCECGLVLCECRFGMGGFGIGRDLQGNAISAKGGFEGGSGGPFNGGSREKGVSRRGSHEAGFERRGSSESIRSEDARAVMGSKGGEWADNEGGFSVAKRQGSTVSVEWGAGEGGPHGNGRSYARPEWTEDVETSFEDLALDEDVGAITGDLEESIKKYINSTNRLMVGERTVMVLNPRIVQRSYGTEKRFLCPQPMALLLGSSWWSNIEAPPSSGVPRMPTANPPRTLEPPEIYISISPSPNPFPLAPDPAITTWMSMNGERTPDELVGDGVIIAGRGIGKGGFVSALCDPGRDRVIKAEVAIVAPGVGTREDRLIGLFCGRPMTVISKPSKRRQAVSSCMTLQHGNLVSLYNRIKSQTGSTRFLGVSGSSSSFPAMDWRAMTGGQVRPYAPADSYSTTFVARTGSWDAFVIYAVDLSLPTLDLNLVPAPAPYPGYPRPPVNAVPFELDAPKGIYYNMPIVLQCLSTAVVSPVMIIRKIETKSTAVGGGSTDGYTPRHAQHLPCAPGEVLGEPVSQFRPLAFEIYSDHSKDRHADPEKLARQQPQNTFLACLGEHIGINQSRDVRKPLPNIDLIREPSPPTPLTPNSDYGGGMPGGMTDYDDDHTSNGAKVRKIRRLSSSNNMSGIPYPSSNTANVTGRPTQASLLKHKRRGVSLGSLTHIKTEFDPLAMILAAPPRWTIDCGDPCVWTIAAVDVARHTFYVPPEVVGGKQPGSQPAPPGTDPLHTTPVPTRPVLPLIPVVCDYNSPSSDPMDVGTDSETMITLYGENFSPRFRAWLGPNPCRGQIIKSSTEMLVVPPPTINDVSSGPTPALRIILVRNDGVVFPSSLFYRPK